MAACFYCGALDDRWSIYWLECQTCELGMDVCVFCWGREECPCPGCGSVTATDHLGHRLDYQVNMAVPAVDTASLRTTNLPTMYEPSESSTSDMELMEADQVSADSRCLILLDLEETTVHPDSLRFRPRAVELIHEILTKQEQSVCQLAFCTSLSRPLAVKAAQGLLEAATGIKPWVADGARLTGSMEVWLLYAGSSREAAPVLPGQTLDTLVGFKNLDQVLLECEACSFGKFHLSSILYISSCPSVSLEATGATARAKTIPVKCWDGSMDDCALKMVEDEMLSVFLASGGACA